MRTKFYLVLFGLLPLVGFAQVKHPVSQMQTQSPQREITPDSICDNMLFTRAEVPPTPKVEKTTFEDSLTSYLKSKNAFPESGHIYFKFVVTKDGKLIYQTASGNITDNKEILKYILAHQDIWNNAKQNGRNVCAFSDLDINFNNGKLEANFPIRK